MKKIVVAVFWISATNFLFAQQSQVKSCSVFSGAEALITEWYDTMSIVYSKDAKNNHQCFMAEIYGYPYGKYITLPDEMMVNDMDYRDERLAFCGSYTKSGVAHGLIGRVFAPNSFGWGQSMDYFYFDWINSQNENVLMTDIKRMVYINNQPSPVVLYYRLACVGDCLVAKPSGDTVKKTAVCEIYYNDTSQWTAYVYLNNDDDVVFTDITEIDNYIVAVAYNAQTKNVQIKTFDHLYPFVSYPVVPNMAAEVADDQVGDNVLVEALDDNIFATANYYCSDYDAGSTLKIFDCGSGLPVLMNSSHFTQNPSPFISPNWSLHELKYETTTSLLYLLQDMDYPVNASIISAVNEYDIANFSFASLMTSWIKGLQSYGLGLWARGGFQTAGTRKGILTTYKKNGLYYPTDCANIIQKNYNLNAPVILNVTCVDEVLSGEYENLSYSFTPVIAPVDLDCEE